MSTSDKTTKPRKILLISADQWRAECLSAIDHPVVKTPNLDALAKDGVLFKRHYTVCAPCGPSRTSLLTGMYLMNHRSGRNGTPLDARHSNLALEARKAGFDPTLFGYTDTSHDPRTRPLDDPQLKTYEGVMPGFTVGMQLPDHMAPWIADLKAKGYPITGRDDVYRPRMDVELPAGRGHNFRPTIFSADDSETTFMADTVLKWLSVRQHEDWFVHCVFLRPHPPVIAPEPYHAMYDPADVALPQRKASPAEEAAQHPHLKLWIDLLAKGKMYDEHNVNNFVTMDEINLRQMRATYYAMITQVDDQIGRLIAHLKSTGEYDQTLIIFTCDHAEMGGDHYTWGKETYFEQSFHIPLIIRDPRKSADSARGHHVDKFTESVDIVPTILDWLGRDIPAQCDGHSLLPFLQGQSPLNWRDAVHYEVDFRYTPNLPRLDAEVTLGLSPDDCYFTVIRDENFKYVHFANLPPLLFDMRTDPFEMHNLAERPEHTATMLRYAQKMLSWRMRHADRTLANFHLSEEGVFDGRRRSLVS
jgi:arylsulfatase A-like enzyme